jgi:hypothetical protein
MKMNGLSKWKTNRQENKEEYTEYLKQTFAIHPRRHEDDWQTNPRDNYH